ncbi:hypothetical protein [Bradyrhizobium sp. 188]|uniref:hypothetical protein n=1 Tax=Bradyrhizobium sp. 188 TaxID=2782656 RepID=UPI001FFBE782|nr:hypothetical protein [Bradyrhizobium sp. 188]MCK1501494.1 hypothetical protein [Bradyrhizobium sp. 188]
MAKATRAPLPWDRVDLTNTEVASIRAVSEGVADPEQQRVAYKAIIHKLCAVDRASFTILGGDEGRRATDFAEGKRWVGNTIRFQIVEREYPVDPRGAPPPMPDTSTTEGND